MGILNQIGINNGFTDFLGQHRSALINAGVGFAGGTGLGESLAGAARGIAQGAPQDDAYATAQKAEAERQKAITDQAALRAKYADFFAQNNQPDWSKAVADGLVEPGAAYIEFLKGNKPDYATFTTKSGDVMRYDKNSADAKPSMLYDAPAEPLVMSPGQVRIDPETNKELFTVPPKSNADPNEIASITDAIISGQQPPTLQGMYGNTVHIRAALADKGYDLTKAQQDFNSTSRLLASMNGPQQLRLRQAVAFTKESLPQIEDLSKQWQAGQFPALNAANLELAKNGAFGQAAASLATRLDTQIKDMTSELGTVYKGGNSSTDESLKLAASNLNANWSAQTLMDSIKQIKQNLVYRENSFNLVQTAGFQDSQYNPMTGPQPTDSAPAGVPDGVDPADWEYMTPEERALWQ